MNNWRIHASCHRPFQFFFSSVAVLFFMRLSVSALLVMSTNELKFICNILIHLSYTWPVATSIIYNRNTIESGNKPLDFCIEIEKREKERKSNDSHTYFVCPLRAWTVHGYSKCKENKKKHSTKERRRASEWTGLSNTYYEWK